MKTKDDEDELLRSVALQNANSILIARQRAEQRNEAYLAEAQRLSHTGSFGWRLSTGEILWSEETFRIFQHDRAITPTVERLLQRVHPEDAPLVKQTFERASQDGKNFEHEYRLVMPDGSVKYVHVVAHAFSDGSGGIEFVGAVMDVTVAKQAEENLRHSEAYLHEAQRLGRMGSWTRNVSSGTFFASPELVRIVGGDPDEQTPTEDMLRDRVHPEDRPLFEEKVRNARSDKSDLDHDFRIVLPDGSLKHVHCVSHPVFDESGDLVEYLGTVVDVTDRQRANEERERLLTREQAAHAKALAAQHRFGDLVNSIEGVVWELDVPTFTFSFVSKPAERMLGYALARWLNEPTFWKDHIHPDDRSWAVDFCATATAEKRDHDFEYRMIAADGRIVWIRDMVTVVVEGGQAARLRGVMFDITERKRDELLLAGEKRLLEMIARSESRAGILDALCRLVEELAGGSLASILLLDPNARCLRHGAAPSMPTPYIEAIDGVRIGPSVGSCGTAAYRGEPVIVSDIATDPLWTDYRDLALGHGLRACWSTPILSSEGRVLGTFAIYYREPRTPAPQEQNVIERITHLASIAVERERAEAELRMSEEQWRDVFENNPTMYFMVDAAGSVMAVNPFGAGQLGYDVDELVGQPVLSVSYEPDREAVQRHVASCLEQLGQAISWDARMVRRDGTLLSVRETAKAVSRADGPIVLIACEDITEKRRAEEALRQAQADLAHVNRVTTMGELTASLAHEVNQPIAATVTNGKTCLRWLAGDTPNIEKARAAAMRIVEDGTRAADIISRTRRLFTKGTPQRELVDVNELIREMIVLLRNEAMQYAVSVRTELAADLPQITGDRVQLQQVLMNVIMNSIDAMKDVDGTRELVITSQRADAAQLLVSVSDTGIGLPPQQDKIFSAFFTTKRDGIGMGLSISRSIVESHGGQLWASDNAPRGARISLTLPTRVEAHE